MDEDFDKNELTEQLINLKKVVSEKAENVDLTEKQLDNFQQFFESVNQKVRQIRTVRAARIKAENEKKVEEERKKTEYAARERAIIAHENQLEEARQRLEQSVFDVSATSIKSETPPLNNESLLNTSPEDTEIEDAEVDGSEPANPTSNDPHVDFLSFIQADGAYLMLSKQEFAPKLKEDIKNERIGYPLGVAYDEIIKLWLVCDRDNSKVLLINTKKQAVNICDAISHPTALIIYEEGKSAAILCSTDARNNHMIYIYHYSVAEPFLQTFASFEDPIYDIRFQLRGIAKSDGKNLLSIENAPRGKRLRVFKREVGGKGFEIPGAASPSFLATYRTTVAVSDLGNNKVYIINFDDKDWSNISFNPIRVIEATNDLACRDLANVAGFKFVAGMQFDTNGYLLIGDAKGHSIKLFDTDYNFLHRISSDFVLPYVSSFYVNKAGECILLDVQNYRERLMWVKMSSIPQILDWVSPPGGGGGGASSASSSYQGRPRRGGYQQHRQY
ncbi:hypothetical protein GCK72_000331 [Caenorhabditis remanei]|uniref:Uncharacterized protein n=1 Tax=Caenorhabditis remanei TaxID=31234 RepID=A0A6A5HLT1_CAERE|nr:hypothetical protein GCK72_000331 [Caenorhabditis remanei]KAF1768519.1 hypothetical protein GCK72_000331 [Caenorhabditis remanei]